MQGWVGELFTFQLAERVAGDAGGFGRLRLSEPLVVSALTKSISDVNSQLCITLDYAWVPCDVGRTVGAACRVTWAPRLDWRALLSVHS